MAVCSRLGQEETPPFIYWSISRPMNCRSLVTRYRKTGGTATQFRLPRVGHSSEWFCTSLNIGLGTSLLAPCSRQPDGVAYRETRKQQRLCLQRNGIIVARPSGSERLKTKNVNTRSTHRVTHLWRPRPEGGVPTPWRRAWCEV